MSCKNDINDLYLMPYIIISESIAIEVSDSFIELTGYGRTEILDRNVDNIFSVLLRLNTNINNLEKDYRSFFIFTKDLEPREVEITITAVNDRKIVAVGEKPHSRLEGKLPYAEHLYHYEKSGIAVYSAQDLTLLRANQTYIAFLNEPYNKKENCMGKRVEELVKGYKRSCCKEIWTNLLSTGEAFYADEVLYEGYDRGTSYRDLSIVPIYECGKIKYFIESTTEVTEKVLYRKHIEEQNKQLMHKEQQLETIFETLADVVMVYDRDCNLINMSSAAKGSVYQGNKIKNIDDLCSGRIYLDDKDNIIPIDEMPHRLALQGEKVSNFKFKVKRPDKVIYIDSNASPIYDSEGNIVMVVLCCREITDIVNKEQELIAQKSKLEAIISNMSDGLELVDNNFRITFLNQSAKDFFHAPDLKAKDGDSSKHIKFYYGIDGEEIPESDLPSYKVFDQGGFQNYILTIHRPDKKLYASVNGSPIYDCKGIAREALLCIRDITQRVLKDKALKYHQEIALQSAREKNEALEKALEMKDEFLSLISHEFKTPLTVINSAIQTMELICRDELSIKARGFISKIQQNSNRQLRLVNNLLDITKINAGHIKINRKNIDIVFLTKAITDSVQLFAAQKKIALSFSSGSEYDVIGIDDEKYERILLNLLSNAIKFTPEGRSIKVDLQIKRGRLCIKVSDTGIGIPNDKQKLIFERFSQVDNTLTRQAEGTGIGLSLVKMLVEALGGSISVKSRLGKGSTFTILLPAGKIEEKKEQTSLCELADNRLIQSTAIEFSDIYLDK